MIEIGLLSIKHWDLSQPVSKIINQTPFRRIIWIIRELVVIETQTDYIYLRFHNAYVIRKFAETGNLR